MTIMTTQSWRSWRFNHDDHDDFQSQSPSTRPNIKIMFGVGNGTENAERIRNIRRPHILLSYIIYSKKYFFKNVFKKTKKSLKCLKRLIISFFSYSRSNSFLNTWQAEFLISRTIWPIERVFGLAFKPYRADKSLKPFCQIILFVKMVLTLTFTQISS